MYRTAPHRAPPRASRLYLHLHLHLLWQMHTRKSSMSFGHRTVASMQVGDTGTVLESIA
jgi:hypothetical protein